MIEDYLRWRDRLARALDPRFHPIKWLDRQILEGRAAVIGAQDACVVVEIRTYPGGAREVHGLVAAGSPETIVSELIPRAEEMGRESGCAFGCVESRGAWSRLLKASGYEVHQVTVRKEL